MKSIGQNTSSREDAFTLTELLVVIATLAILTALLAPALASTKPNGRANQCLENQRRIVLSWRMYADDNNDILPPNDYPFLNGFTGASPVAKDRLRSWVVGTMASPLDAAYINASKLLLDSHTLMSPYLRTIDLYKCPAENSLTPAGQPRARSYSMSNAVGTRWWNTSSGGGPALGPVGSPVGGGWLSGSFSDPDPNYVTFGKGSSFVAPGPANTWITIEENVQTMNDGLMAVAVPANNNPANAVEIDFAAATHDRAASLAFADGHSEMHRWLDARTYTPLSSGSAGTPGSPIPTPNNPDVVWIAARTTVHR